MKYISPQGEYPRHQGDIQLENPSWTPGDDLPEGWQFVQDTERPEPGENEIVFEQAPAEIDGTLYQSWAVRPMTQEEIDRKNAPLTARQKMIDLGFTEAEIEAILLQMIR